MANQNTTSQTQAAVAPKNGGVKLMKLTYEFTVPVNQNQNLLGGKQSANGFDKETRYALFYLRHAIKDLNGNLIKQEDVK